jgi:hypothetical protein
MGFRKRLGHVEKEHDAELANDGVEHRIRKRQSLGVRVTPRDSRRGQQPRRLIDHRLIEIGRVDRHSLGQVSGQGAGDDPRAGGRFQKPTRTKIGEAPGDIPGVGCEDQWPQKMIVYSGNRPREHPVCFHRPSLPPREFGRAPHSKRRIAR